MPQGNAFGSFIPIILLFVIFYFFLIRPQKAKEKEHQKMIAGLAKNDEVVTSGGIHGTIVNVKEKTIVLRVDENVKMEIEKTCVAALLKSQK
ncbi:MAG: preprotein translocase subunit YajC [Candidatus Omnitrophota bacterium]|nr:MAG: preprotein translocase subunit YajC [Candidatus Omnitrophota bacterium]